MPSQFVFQLSHNIQQSAIGATAKRTCDNRLSARLHPWEAIAVCFSTVSSGSAVGHRRHGGKRVSLKENRRTAFIQVTDIANCNALSPTNKALDSAESLQHITLMNFVKNMIHVLTASETIGLRLWLDMPNLRLIVVLCCCCSK